MSKQKRQQGCWRYSILNAILPNLHYTLGDTFCQEERQERLRKAEEKCDARLNLRLPQFLQTPSINMTW